MPGIAQLCTLALALGSVVVEAVPKFNNARPRTIEIRAPKPIFARQASATTTTSAAASATSSATSSASSSSSQNLTDIDILQFALTLEHLESTFYSQGFAKFPDSDFMALGLTSAQVSALKTVGGTEATHVTQLQAAISAAGSQPVQPCQYNFGFTDAKSMVATARVLEAVGISAYLGAAPLVSSKAVLGAAASIVTIEARHQTFIRSAGGDVPVPNAFDSALGPRAVFTLAAPFISSCPTGSNLAIQAFPSIALAGGGAGITGGQSLVLADPSQPAGASFCAFVDVSQTQYSQISGGSCTVPANLTGEVYMMVTKSQSIADSEVLAGPSVILSS
ncbi:uncharacterized protein PV09_02297 [Verruconis gallopava]|uniref:Protein rds1 n=1 Tax=Verruconis gallopava TaxID=253628 RepID=A0A0D2AI92_9PEZI|nr:uncharacterized protein PV09_02297 [Verruconis gallopava]KIW06578.1 hypothetical protein PV09_02297 [Verruconis gallopava]